MCTKRYLFGEHDRASYDEYVCLLNIYCDAHVSPEPKYSAVFSPVNCVKPAICPNVTKKVCCEKLIIIYFDRRPRTREVNYVTGYFCVVGCQKSEPTFI